MMSIIHSGRYYDTNECNFETCKVSSLNRYHCKARVYLKVTAAAEDLDLGKVWRVGGI